MIKIGIGAFPVLAASLLSGCSAASIHPGPPAQPPPAGAAAYSLYTHCGIDEALVGTTYFAADNPLSDGNGNPPAGWGNPTQQGRIWLTSASTAIFEDTVGHVVHFHARLGATSFERICS